MNADVLKGKLLIEILDEFGNPYEGFTAKDCLVIKKVDATKILVCWKNQKDLSSLAGKNIRLKFHLTKGALYSFWISPWKTGESRGYTAGGGPGLNSAGIDIPNL